MSRGIWGLRFTCGILKRFSFSISWWHDLKLLSCCLYRTWGYCVLNRKYQRRVYMGRQFKSLVQIKQKEIYKVKKRECSLLVRNPHLWSQRKGKEAAKKSQRGTKDDLLVNLNFFEFHHEILGLGLKWTRLLVVMVLVLLKKRSDFINKLQLPSVAGMAKSSYDWGWLNW